MFHAKLIAGFLGRFILVFVLLMAPWPGLKDGYAAFYRAAGNSLFTRFGDDGRVHFRSSTRPDPDRNLEVVLKNWRTGSEYVFAGTSAKGYNPTAFVVALILATPIPWRRRLRALLWGLVSVNVYVALRILLFLVVAFSGDNALALFTPGPLGQGILDYLNWVVVESFAGALLLPLPIWILVSFKRDDLRTILATPFAAARSDTTTSAMQNDLGGTGHKRRDDQPPL